MDGLILVTGGAGFIGAHLVDALLTAGYDVRVLDDFSTGKHENLRGAEALAAAHGGHFQLIAGDVRSEFKMRDAVDGCAAVCHLAAVASVTQSLTDPVGTGSVTHGGTVNAVRMAVDADVPRFVLASSCAVYGDAAQLPVAEACAPRPLSPYAEAKLAAEQTCAAAADAGQLTSACLRFFNVYGPRQDPGSEYSGVISRFMAAVATGEPVTVYGDGLQTRDFVYVGDVVEAIVRAVQRPLSGVSVLNVGSGTPVSVMDVLGRLEELVGGPIERRFEAARGGEIRDSRADAGRARWVLGWEPGETFAGGLEKTWTWYRERAGERRAGELRSSAGRRRPGGGHVPSVRRIMVGAVPVGGGAPVAVQSMTCTRTGDAAATLAQVRTLVAAGCELVRVSLPTAEEAPAFARLVREAPALAAYDAPVPIIADIHYDWRLALAAIEAGAAGIRINPGTMAEKHVHEIVRAAAEAAVAVRIGVNAGSLPRDLRGKAERDPAAALVEAALRWAARFDEWGFRAYKLSVKSSSVPVTLEAYRLLAARTDAPLHVGVTEAGTVWSGTIKSAVGIGALLAGGIGDTVRVSLTGDPVEEVRVAWKILAALDLRRRGPEVISCPTCGRTEVDIVGLAEEVERRLAGDAALAGSAITVAVMGCRVNGPEEARHADYGIAAGAGEGVLFDHGERVAALPEGQLVDALLARIRGAGA